MMMLSAAGDYQVVNAGQKAVLIAILIGILTAIPMAGHLTILGRLALWSLAP
jgi:hypothetical protein